MPHKVILNLCLVYVCNMTTGNLSHNTPGLKRRVNELREELHKINFNNDIDHNLESCLIDIGQLTTGNMTHYIPVIKSRLKYVQKLLKTCYVV